MNSRNLTHIGLATLIVACTTTAQTNAMMIRYIASLVGDAFIASSLHTMKVTEIMTADHEAAWQREGVKHSAISQLKHDAKKIAPYAPLLMPIGAVLSIGSRISMISKAGTKGIALALLSMPLNGILIKSGYEARLEQAPDATLIDKTKDTMWYNKWFGKKNS